MIWTHLSESNLWLSFKPPPLRTATEVKVAALPLLVD